MNIILFTNKRGQIWNFELNLLHFGVTAVTGLVVLLAVAVYSGTRIAGNEPENVANWQGMAEEQQAEVVEARRNAQADIDALTLGDLDKEEFDFDAVPAVGGPGDEVDVQSVPLADFLSMLDTLDNEMQDREQKLSVLESGKKGSEVIVVGDGVVSWAGKRTGYGNLIEINHGNGYTTRYGHNQRHLVEVGEKVKKGQQIALMGSTGRSTGPHVHFEVLQNGKSFSLFRPANLQAHAVSCLLSADWIFSQDSWQLIFLARCLAVAMTDS
jgi:hypothetical protein